MSKILFISGILTSEEDTRGWRKDLGKISSSSSIIGNENYHQLDFSRIRELLEEGLGLLTEDTTIIAHSFGGLIARSLSNKSDYISRLVLMASPHLSGFNSIYYTGVLGSLRVPREIPIQTYGALGDYVVPPIMAKHPSSLEHTVIDGGHDDFLYDPQVRKDILASIWQ